MNLSLILSKIEVSVIEVANPFSVLDAPIAAAPAPMIAPAHPERLIVIKMSVTAEIDL